MRDLMHGLHFTNINIWPEFKKEFEFSMPKNELLKFESGLAGQQQHQVLRFDFMRRIFLDRGL